MFSGRKRKADEDLGDLERVTEKERPYKAAGGNENRVSQAFLH